MEKIDLTKQFAHRLRDTLLAKGHASERSTSGININKLAEITGYSPQICRRYLRGQAIPEPGKLVEIARELKVSPGWLLFGDSFDDEGHGIDKITLPKKLLEYIFIKAKPLYNGDASQDEIASFLLELAEDVSQISDDFTKLTKIVDIALGSATHFNK